MKRSTLIFFLSLTFFYSYAQFEDYRLDQYVNPEYKKQSLDFSAETTGNFYSEKTEYEDSHSDDKRTSSLLDGNFTSSYAKIQNSLKKQSETSLLLTFDGLYSKEKDEDVTRYRENKLSVYLSYDNDTRYYFANKQFIELLPDVYGRVRSEKVTNTDTGTGTDYESKSYYMNLSFRAGYGKGRIEHVEDARLAVYLLSDLKKSGVLLRDLSPGDIDNLAQTMTKVKNKRHFDSRVRLIDEISTVDSFLVANGIVESQNTARYFTLLYDNWQYAGLITRLSGSRFSGGLEPGYYWSKYDSNNNNRIIYNSQVTGAAYVNYRYEKPVNLYWQHSAHVELMEQVGRSRGVDENFWNTYLGGSFGLGYFPNSRTYMYLRLSEYFDYRKDQGYDMINSNTSLAFNMYYYLSPQLRISADARAHYYYSKYTNDEESNGSTTNLPSFYFGAKLTYSLF